MRVGFKTLEVGEQALIYSLEGRARVEDGPQRIFLWREKFIRLKRYSADQNNYLKLTYRNGDVEHRPGPCIVFMNLLEYSSIQVKEGISLDANEVLVVYQQKTGTKDVKRYLLHGPTRFIPQANEWFHEFRWHGTDPDNKTRMIPGCRVFTRLKVIPDQFYYNVDEVRTLDHALIRVKLMMFYELTDIEMMLNSTMDPIGDFINCLCADVVNFASKLTYIEFTEQSSKLNDLNNYSRLLERCKMIGYKVTKVVYRGYFAGDKLQNLHENSAQKRTNLKIQFETVEQDQALIDSEMKAEVQQTALKQKMELEQLKHRQELERSQLQHALKMQTKEHERKIQQTRKEHEATLQAKVAADEEKLKHYHELHGLNVKLSEYLTSQNPRPNKLVKVVTPKDGAQLHLHQ